MSDCNTTEVKKVKMMNIKDKGLYWIVQSNALPSEGGTSGNSDEEK